MLKVKMGYSIELTLPVALGAGFLSGLVLSGCLVPDETSSSPTTTDPGTTTTDPETTTETGSGTDTTTATGSTSSTTTTTFDPSCFGQPTAENTVEKCGVFARAGADPALADGTREHPYPTLQKAVSEAAAQGKRVFACTVGSFAESVVVDAQQEIWGGLDCTNEWSYQATARTVLKGLVEQPAMFLTVNAGGSRIVSFFIESPDAVSPGGSSVPIIADAGDKETTFWRCDLVAGNGADGADDSPPNGSAPAGANAALPGQIGGATAACTSSPVSGGDAGMTSCDDGQSAGGKGGNGGLAPAGAGQSGQDGSPTPASNPMQFGEGGDGQSVAACTNGSPGAPGLLGVHGEGGWAKGIATVDGIQPVNGMPGTGGARGQGGGGGGGAKAGTFCMPGLVAGAGASGGGGGAGGCGGKGGNGGKSGGNSIGVISLGSDIRMLDSTITTGKGGKGGQGAAGQAGGAGGQGAPGGASSGLAGSSAGCAGGDGGTGGLGGSGGGGRGGHSIGIVYHAPFGPAWMGSSWFLGAQGEGGLGGPGNESAGKGAAGIKDAQRNFSQQP